VLHDHDGRGVALNEDVQRACRVLELGHVGLSLLGRRNVLALARVSERKSPRFIAVIPLLARTQIEAPITLETLGALKPTKPANVRKIQYRSKDEDAALTYAQRLLMALKTSLNAGRASDKSCIYCEKKCRLRRLCM
jgi:hypothetical protein